MMSVRYNIRPSLPAAALHPPANVHNTQKKEASAPPSTSDEEPTPIPQLQRRKSPYEANKLCKTYLKEGSFHKVIECSTHIIRHNPEIFHKYRALAYEGLGLREDALYHFEMLLKINFNLSSTLDVLEAMEIDSYSRNILKKARLSPCFFWCILLAVCRLLPVVFLWYHGLRVRNNESNVPVVSGSSEGLQWVRLYAQRRRVLAPGQLSLRVRSGATLQRPPTTPFEYLKTAPLHLLVLNKHWSKPKTLTNKKTA